MTNTSSATPQALQPSNIQLLLKESAAAEAAQEQQVASLGVETPSASQAFHTVSARIATSDVVAVTYTAVAKAVSLQHAAASTSAAGAAAATAAAESEASSAAETVAALAVVTARAVSTTSHAAVAAPAYPSLPPAPLPNSRPASKPANIIFPNLHAWLSDGLASIFLLSCAKSVMLKVEVDGQQQMECSKASLHPAPRGGIIVVVDNKMRKMVTGLKHRGWRMLEDGTLVMVLSKTDISRMTRGQCVASSVSGENGWMGG